MVQAIPEMIEINQRKDQKTAPKYVLLGIAGLLLVACVVALAMQPSSAPATMPHNTDTSTTKLTAAIPTQLDPAASELLASMSIPFAPPLNLNAKYTAMKCAGGWGGAANNDFTNDHTDWGKITSIQVRDASWIDYIKVTYSNRPQGQQIGNPNGGIDRGTITLAADEYVNGVLIIQKNGGQYLDGFLFSTNKGHVYGYGSLKLFVSWLTSASIKDFYWNAFAVYGFSPAQNMELRGIGGRGASFVDRLCIYYSPKQVKRPAPAHAEATLKWDRLGSPMSNPIKYTVSCGITTTTGREVTRGSESSQSLATTLTIKAGTETTGMEQSVSVGASWTQSVTNAEQYSSSNSKSCSVEVQCEKAPRSGDLVQLWVWRVEPDDWKAAGRAITGGYKCTYSNARVHFPPMPQCYPGQCASGNVFDNCQKCDTSANTKLNDIVCA